MNLELWRELRYDTRVFFNHNSMSEEAKPSEEVAENAEACEEESQEESSEEAAPEEAAAE